MKYDKEMIARIKAGTDMFTLCNRLGIELKKQGRASAGSASSYMGHCPFHEDTTPSLSVNASRGLFHCFGCGEKGDALALVEKVKGCGFQEALKYLAELTGVAVQETSSPRSLSAAAEMIDRYQLKTLDAIQLSSALMHNRLLKNVNFFNSLFWNCTKACAIPYCRMVLKKSG
jgi:DNA primase